MRVDIEPNNNITFKSGYPTFGTSGHLNSKPDVNDFIYDNVYIGFKPMPKPSGLLKKGESIDYFA